jgi:hypothetical protein
MMALAFTAVLLPSSGQYFGRFFGAAHPLLVVAVVSVVGAAALRALTRLGFAIVRGRSTVQGIGLSAVLATAIALAVVIADIIIRYPRDLNVPLPQAPLFYPVVGLVAEVVFHLLPLAILLPALNLVAGRLGKQRVVWLGILLAATLEPTFQVVLGGTGSAWSAVYTWLHVFTIAVLQLYVFRRFDFAAMYSFRLIYYAYWHILWGVIRLRVLF